jgi:hypothetical protein
MRGKVAEVAGSCIFCSMLSAEKRTAASSRVVQMLCGRSTAACVTICRRSSLRDSDKYTMLGRLGVSPKQVYAMPTCVTSLKLSVLLRRS